MKSTIARLGPYAKPLAILAAIVVAVVAQAAGVDLGLDVEELWAALGAAVLAFFVPAPGYRAPGEDVDGRDVPKFDAGDDDLRL